MATVQNTPTMAGSINAIGNLSTSNVVATFDKEVWDEYLYEKYPKYTVAPLLERLGRLEEITQETFYWAELDRTRQFATVSDNGGSPVTTGTPGTTVTVEVDEADQYFIVGDVLETPTRRLAVVTVIDLTGPFTSGNQILTLEEIDGNNLADADFLVGAKLIHRYNINPECSTAPEGRVWQPEQKSNSLTTIRRTAKVCDAEFGNVKWMGITGESPWYHANQAYTEREFVIDRESVIVFGQTGTQTSNSAVSGYGIFDQVYNNGAVTSFTGAVTEDDIIDQINELKVYGNATEYLVLVGNEFMRDITKALKDYHVNGGITYGSFAQAGLTVGLNVGQYRFGDVLLSFVEYPLFTDPNLNSGVAGGFDYQNVALFVDMGNAENGEPLIKLKTKKNPMGGNDYFHVESGAGMPGMFGLGEGNAFANGEACYYMHMYGKVAVQLANLNNHGLMYKA